jgi:hypothetical protein
MISKSKEIAVYWLPTGFKRVSGDDAETFLFTEITRILISRNKGEATLSIRVTAGPRDIRLSGLDRLDELAAGFEKELPDRCEKKSNLVDWGRPHYVLLAAALVTALAVFVMARGGPTSEWLSIQFLNIPAGAWLIFRRPLTKNMGPQFKRAELAVGTALILIPILWSLSRFVDL